LTSGKKHKSNLTSGQFERTVRYLCQCNKKLNHSHSTKKIEFLLLPTFGTFAFAANAQANPEAKAKEPNLHPSNSNTFEK